MSKMENKVNQEKRDDQGKTKEINKKVVIDNKSGDRRSKNAETKEIVFEKNNKKRRGTGVTAIEKKKAGGFRLTLRAIFLLLMGIYAVAALVIGGWAYINFFQSNEKSPVLGVNTPNSRIKDLPEVKDEELKAAVDAVKNSGIALEQINIRKVGPSIRFYLVIPEPDDMSTARQKAADVLNKFTEAVGKPELFGSYEAQIIITKASVKQPAPEILLRPAEQDGVEQQFPQFGVSNKGTNGAARGISWGRNGE